MLHERVGVLPEANGLSSDHIDGEESIGHGACASEAGAEQRANALYALNASVEGSDDQYGDFRRPMPGRRGRKLPDTLKTDCFTRVRNASQGDCSLCSLQSP